MIVYKTNVLSDVWLRNAMINIGYDILCDLIIFISFNSKFQMKNILTPYVTKSIFRCEKILIRHSDSTKPIEIILLEKNSIILPKKKWTKYAGIRCHCNSKSNGILSVKPCGFSTSYFSSRSNQDRFMNRNEFHHEVGSVCSSDSPIVAMPTTVTVCAVSCEYAADNRLSQMFI